MHSNKDCGEKRKERATKGQDMGNERTVFATKHLKNGRPDLQAWMVEVEVEISR